MRLIQAVIPEGKKEVIIDLLKERGIDYVISPETSQRKYSDVLFFPLPKEGVEEVLDELQDAGLEKNGFTVVTKAEAIVAEEFEELQERYEESEETDESKLARQELKTSAENLAPPSPTYYLLLVAASIIATAGILMDNAAIVVGSMVIAPLIGPAMSSCVGTVINDEEMFYQATKKQVLGILLTIASSIGFTRLALAVLLPANLDLFSLNQITNQLNPGFLSLVVALGSGLAGAFSLTAGVNSALVGVMISVALLPPAAAAGIGISIANVQIAAGASLLLVINLVSINLAGTFTLWFQGYEPGKWYEQEGAKQVTKSRLFILIALILAVATFLGFVTYQMRVSTLRAERLQELSENRVSEAGGEIRSFQVDKRGLFFEKIKAVSIRFRSETYPQDLGKQVKKDLEEWLGRSIELDISYVRAVNT